MIEIWTEDLIQKCLACSFNARKGFCVPNCGPFGWESDLIRVTPRLFSSEYEIKISVGDFRKDKAKVWKHMILEDRDTKRPVPNFFWYVAPEKLINQLEVPEHAGLLEIVTRSYFRVAKPAPKLHDKPLQARESMFLARGASLRYWRQVVHERVSVPAPPDTPS